MAHPVKQRHADTGLPRILIPELDGQNWATCDRKTAVICRFRRNEVIAGELFEVPAVK
jgi:hypothetical protein